MTAFTEDDLARIKKAIAQGVLTVTFADGRSVTFSNFEELSARYHFIAKELGLEAGRQRMLGEYRKGVAP